MIPFARIHEQAVSRQGGAEALESKLPVPRSNDELRAVDDSEYLSLMSRRVFRAGLRHSMVDARWPAFERAFFRFEIGRVRMMSDEELDELMRVREIIRHWGKIKSVRANAQSIYELQKSHGSVGNYLADWPGNRIINLWDDLKQRFTQLGGHSGPYFLRMSGKDTFLMTKSVIQGLEKFGLIHTQPAGNRGRQEVEAIFNAWQEQCGRPLCQLSMILALSVD